MSVWAKSQGKAKRATKKEKLREQKHRSVFVLMLMHIMFCRIVSNSILCWIAWDSYCSYAHTHSSRHRYPYTNAQFDMTSKKNTAMSNITKQDNNDDSNIRDEAESRVEPNRCEKCNNDAERIT